jgi:methyl-accepting chemotaxis protein
MAGDVTTSVTAVVSVIDKASPAIDQITKSLENVDQVAKQINTSVPRSVEEMVKAAPGNIFNLRVRGEDVVPDLAPAAAAQAEQIGSIWERLTERLRGVGASIKTHLGGAFEAVVGIASRVGSVLSTIFTGLGGFAAGYGIAGAISAMVSGMDELVATVDKLGPQAKNLGITIAELQRLQLWAREGGANINTVTTSLQNLTKTIGGVEAGAKGFGKAAEAFETLGISMRDQAGNLKTVTQIVPELAAALQQVADPAQRAQLAAAALGRSWQELLPLFLQGPEAVAAAAEMSKKLGEISEDQQAAAENYKRVTAEYQTAMASLRMTIGEKLLPVLTPVIEKLTEFIAANREAIGAGFQAVVDGLIAAFATLGPLIASTAKDLQGIGAAVKAVIDLLPSIKLPDLTVTADPVTKLREGIIAALEAVEQFFATISTKGDEVLGGLAAKIGDAFRRVSEALQTPISDVWTGAADAISRAWGIIEPILSKFWQMLQEIAKWTGLGGVATAFEGIAGSITKAQEAWQKWRGTTETPTAVSPGGGPMSWEDLTGRTPGGLIGPAPGAAPNGQVDVNVTLANAPPGTRATTQTTGTGVRTQADVGYSMPWTQPAYSGPWAPAAG